jgi:hypothetical protein
LCILVPEYQGTPKVLLYNYFKGTLRLLYFQSMAPHNTAQYRW